MTRGTLRCCACGADGHDSYACPQPLGAEYVPEPVCTTDDAGETWIYTMPGAIVPCTPTLPQRS